MRFQRFAPPAPLQPYVQYFWTLTGDTVATGQRLFRTIADGCPGLIFQQSGPGTVYDQDKDTKPWPTLLLYGQSTKPRAVYAAGPLHLVGACLQPSALLPVFGVRADELTDSCVELEGLASSYSATESLLAEASVPAQIDRLAALLLAHLRANRQWTDPGLHYALAQLLDSGGRVPLPQLQRALGVSERSFQRKFKHYVGVPPKLFARICRFQASLRQLRAAQYTKLSDLAFEHEYADQSHHIRAFQEFAGVSPHQFRQELREIIDNFAELL